MPHSAHNVSPVCWWIFEKRSCKSWRSITKVEFRRAPCTSSVFESRNSPSIKGWENIAVLTFYTWIQTIPRNRVKKEWVTNIKKSEKEFLFYKSLEFLHHRSLQVSLQLFSKALIALTGIKQHFLWCFCNNSAWTSLLWSGDSSGLSWTLNEAFIISFTVNDWIAPHPLLREQYEYRQGVTCLDQNVVGGVSWCLALPCHNLTHSVNMQWSDWGHSLIMKSQWGI